MVGRVTAMLGVTLRVLLATIALGTASLSLKAWIDAPHAWQPAGLAAAQVIAPISAMLVMVAIPAGLRLIGSRKRALRDLLLVISAAGMFFALAAGSAALVIASTVSVTTLMLARPLWSQVGDRPAERRGWTLLGAAAIAAVALLLFDQPSGAVLLFFGGMLVATIAAAAWGLTLLLRNAPLPPESDRGPVRSVYGEHAAAGITPFALMNDKRWFWSRDRNAFLAYGLGAGVAVVLGPGVGPARSVAALYADFRAACQRSGWKLGFYQVSGAVADALGWGVRRQIGSEAIIDLGRLTLEGPAMAKLRHEVSRGQRNGVTVQIVAKSDVTPAIRRAMDELAAAWLHRGMLGEMTFSVGCRSDQPDAPTTVGLAYDRDGALVAYCSWLSIPAGGGMVLDEIRRTSRTPAGAMDLLLHSCLKHFGAQASWASLGLAPLPVTATGSVQAIADRMLNRLGIVSTSASLLSFKNKFQPRWEPRYIVADQAADWPAVAVATLLLHYPELAQRAYRHLPHLNWQRQARVAAALTGCLVAVAMSTIVVAAAQSREGHPFYQAHVAAARVATVLPLAGRLAPTRSAASAEVRPIVHKQPGRSMAHRRGRPATHGPHGAL